MRSRPALIILVVLLLAVGGGAAAWALFLRGDEVAPLALPSRAPTASSGAAGSGGTATASGATASLPPASAVALDAASMPGSWAIAADSVVGYRVREKLASLSAESDAVGRTSSITGTATIASSGASVSVTAAEFSVDMTTLASDHQMRDNRLRNDGIQTDSFPTSTFKLSAPVAIPAAALTGGQVDVTLHGDLTIHGVTKTVDIPARAQVSGSLIQVLGTLTFPFSDYGINAPNIGGFVTVQDQATLEFQVNLAKS